MYICTCKSNGSPYTHVFLLVYFLGWKNFVLVQLTKDRGFSWSPLPVDASIYWSVEPSLRGLFTKPISNAIGARVNRNV